MPTRFLRALTSSDRERFLETLLGSAAGYGIITLDAGGLITGWNAGARTILGWDEDQVLGRPFALIFTPEDQASGIPQQEMTNALATGLAAAERCYQRGDDTRVWADCSLMPLVDGNGFLKILRDRTPERALRQAEDSLRMAVEATGIGTFDLDPRTGEGHWDERAKALFGLPSDAVISYEATFLAGIHPEDRSRVDEAIQRVLDPSGPGTYEEEYRVMRPDGSVRWVAARGITQVEAGQTIRFVGTAWDVTPRKDSEQHFRLMHQELGHRLKNVLTMVQAIAAQTLRNAISLDEARDTLAARLVALGKAQDAVIGGSADRADIAAILAATLEPLGNCGPDRMRLEGPALPLNAGAALSLALLVHELATNAIKYGALSIPGGRVDLIWQVTDSPASLSLRWTEQDGPTVLPPTRQGFGTRLIMRGLAGTVSGSVDLRYEATGVVCTLEAPLSEVTESP